MNDWKREEAERRRRAKRKENIFVGVVGTLIVLAIIALVFFVRAKAPCWIFPLKEAPTRCLTIDTDSR